VEVPEGETELAGQAFVGRCGGESSHSHRRLPAAAMRGSDQGTDEQVPDAYVDVVVTYLKTIQGGGRKVSPATRRSCAIRQQRLMAGTDRRREETTRCAGARGRSCGAH
jgi:hypothetical protein